MDPHEIFKWVNDGGIIGVLLFVVIAGSKKLWVFGWQFKDLEERYKEVEKSNIMWMQLALQGSHVTQQIAEKIANDGVSPK